MAVDEKRVKVFAHENLKAPDGICYYRDSTNIKNNFSFAGNIKRN